MSLTLLHGAAEDILPTLPPESVDCVVTSPPYWRLRDYAVDGQLGQEATPAEFVERLVGIFAHVMRVLTPTGTAWLNIGDSYVKGRLALVPYRLALELDAYGWFVRSDVIWHKPNAMPESAAKARPGADHEYVFLLTKAARHYYDADAVREPAKWERWGEQTTPKHGAADFSRSSAVKHRSKAEVLALSADKTKRKRSTWSVPTKGYAGAHYAAFPERLIEPMILSGCPEGGTVLDPFIGSGTTARVAARLGRRCIGIDINAEYLEQAAA